MHLQVQRPAAQEVAVGQGRQLLKEFNQEGGAHGWDPLGVCPPEVRPRARGTTRTTLTLRVYARSARTGNLWPAGFAGHGRARWSSLRSAVVCSTMPT